MALSLDDQLLGEKVHNYCSSSEDEEEDVTNEDSATPGAPAPDFKSIANGNVTNTGPKGVLNDWRQFKKLENEKRVEKEVEKAALAKKLSLTCRSHLEDQKEQYKDKQFLNEVSQLDDDFLNEYRIKRLEEMRKSMQSMPTFGKLTDLSSENFVQAIDNENKNVTIIVHLWEHNKPGCDRMNGCLQQLAEEYNTVKFCRITANEAKLSHRFSIDGVPAFLIYKGGDVVGNFINLNNEFGQEFYPSDVEGFLLEHGFLPDQSAILGSRPISSIKNAIHKKYDSDDDDDD